MKPSKEKPSDSPDAGPEGVSGRGGTGGSDDIVPKPGEHDFVSADAVSGEQRSNALDGGSAAAGSGAPAAEGGDAADRSVVEGDIYRVLETGMILNLNRYRGLQVIDVADPEQPAIVGRYSLLGEPVEMYVYDNRALVLLNNWTGYYGARDDVAVQQREGGLLAIVDISNPAQPELIDSLFIEGYVQTSRLAYGSGTASLYVASSHGREQTNEAGQLEWVNVTSVTSFDVGGAVVEQVDQVDLGGYVQDIQAAGDALLVASMDWTRQVQESQVSVIDVSDLQGHIVLGDTVTVQGMVQSQFNMDLYNGVLRVVSSSTWNTNDNTVSTFDASDIAEITPLHACTFGAGQQLYATLFLGNKAFFVTFMRTDPFHAFEIRDDGTCEEKNEFIVSGWNDFFRPVADTTRLIGIGTDDADGGRTPAVSLYDITDLANTTPLIQRAQGATLDWSWSEASYDHRAFSVLEGAVSIAAPDGTIETGLVLLPYGGSLQNGNRYEQINGVQMFTFSDTTVTPRASMRHGTAVRRSFLADENVTANLSDNALSLFNASNPDQPTAMGEVELAPDYGRVLRYGDFIARLKRPMRDYYYYDYTSDQEVPSATVQIVSAADEIDSAEALAELEVPADAKLLKAGDLLAVITQRVKDYNASEYDYHTNVQLFDLSDPTHPVAAGSAETDDLVPSYFGYGGYRGWGDGIGCGLGAYWFNGSQSDGVFALPDALVFTVAQQHEKRIGTQNVCSWYPRYDEACNDGECEGSLQGHRQCTSINGGEDVCRDELHRCDFTLDEAPSCTEVSFEDVRDSLDRNCWASDRYRYWSSYELKALDLRDPEQPSFGELLKMPDGEESVRMLPGGTSVYYTFKEPAEVEGDSRPYVRYFFKQIDFANPAAPTVAEPVNIPGELIEVEGDALYTQDVRWSDTQAETFVHTLELRDARAYLQASHRFAERDVNNVIVSDGQLYVSHQPLYSDFYYERAYQEERELTALTILSADELEPLGEAEVDSWSTLEAVYQGRALYTVPGGLMLFDVREPAATTAQAFFYSNGWPEQILFDGEDVVVAAGRYGIYQFDANTFNLLEE